MTDNKIGAVAGVVGVAVAFTVASYAGLNIYGFEDEKKARDLLVNEAYLQNVQMTGKAGFRTCAGAMLRTDFTAESNGQEISGTVCKGLGRPAFVVFR